MKTRDKQVLIEHKFNTNIEKLWYAITKPEEMRVWLFENIPDFKAEVGFKTQFPVKSGEHTFTHLWRVTKVVLFQKITYNWKYEEYPGDSFVTFEMFEEQDKTRLKLTTEVVEDFPDEIPEFSSESCIGGWNYLIEENLKRFLDGKK